MLTRRELNALTSLVSKLSVAPQQTASRNRRRRRPNAVQTPGSTISVPSNAPSRRRRRGKANNSNSIGNQGVIRLRRREILKTITASDDVSDAVVLAPTTTVMPLLKGISNSFERIVWHSCKIFWKSAVGTTRDGTIAIGIDWDSTSAKPDRGKVVSATPNVSLPVWQNTDLSPMVLPSSRLMTRREYIMSSSSAEDKSPASVLYALTVGKMDQAHTYGDIWIEYDVTLSGTRS